MSDCLQTPVALPTPSGPGAMERALSRLLTIGTTASAVVLLAGLAVHLASPRVGEARSYGEFVPTSLNSLATLWPRLMQGEAAAVMQMGVVLLVLTPVARVAATLATFATRRDWLYVAVSAVVLGVLVVGLVGL